jgi:hypothetical protein
MPDSPAVTAVARMHAAKIPLKHAQRRSSLPIIVREISMPLTKPQPSLQSPSQAPLLLSLNPLVGADSMVIGFK